MMDFDEDESLAEVAASEAPGAAAAEAETPLRALDRPFMNSSTASRTTNGRDQP